jgi:coenzyme Q-binding protein COQ10
MPVFRAMRRVDHSADEMFDLVADVERYSEFVPLCQRHAIRSRETHAGIETLMTDMTVACGIYRESFISRVTLDRANGCILVESTDGPLRRLRTRWTFQSRSDGSCDIGFHLHYELASRTLALLMGAVFDAAFGRFVEAFERRADIVYGRPRAACRSARSLRSPQRERPQNVSVSFS